MSSCNVHTEKQDLSLFDERQYGATIFGSAIPGPQLLSNVNHRLGRHNSLEYGTFHKVKTASRQCFCQTGGHSFG
jgi:hypothetical protein